MPTSCIVNSEGGKCMIRIVDWESRVVKTIMDDDDAYSGIETMAGSLPMTLSVLKSWIHPSGLMCIGMIVSDSRTEGISKVIVRGACPSSTRAQVIIRCRPFGENLTDFNTFGSGTSRCLNICVPEPKFQMQMVPCRHPDMARSPSG